jgi:hypothetical protein
MALAVVEVEHRIPADHSPGSLGSLAAFRSQDLADSRGSVRSPRAWVQDHIPQSSANHRHPLGRMRFESHWSGQVFHESLRLLSISSGQRIRPVSLYKEGYRH